MSEENGSEQQEPVGVEGRVRCAIYARTATASGTKAIDVQVGECRRKADRKGWIVMDAFVAKDQGKSGDTLIGRDGLHTLIAQAESSPRPFDCIMCSEQSRLGRNLTEVFNTIETLNDCGVHLYFAACDFDSRSDSSRYVLLKTAIADEIRRLSLMPKCTPCPCSTCPCFGVPRCDSLPCQGRCKRAAHPSLSSPAHGCNQSAPYPTGAGADDHFGK